jgi:hypothetical protein
MHVHSRASAAPAVTSLLVLAGLASAAAGCGGGGGGSARQATAQQPAPVPTAAVTTMTLLWSSPDQGAADVDTSVTVVLRFDADVDPASVTSALQVTMNGTQPVVSANVVGPEVRIQSQWAENTAYVVLLSDALRSLDGDPAEPVVLAFRTARAPGVPLELALPGGARSGAATVALADGRLLTSGGAGPAGTIAAADLLDPTDLDVAPIASMVEPRWGHALARLADGRVLAAGGIGAASTALDSVELYDPATDRWSAAPFRLAARRALHRLIVLPSGRVAVVGGIDGSPHGAFNEVTAIERIDPRDETIATALPASIPTAGEWVDLGLGKALCAGSISKVWDLDLDPPVATLTRNDMVGERFLAAAVLLQDGRALLAGGLSGAGAAAPASPAIVHSSVEVYDPRTRLFSPLPDLPIGRYGALAVSLVDGRVALVGGAVSAMGQPVAARTAEVIDPAALLPAWSQVMAPALVAPSGEALPGGGLVVTGARASEQDAASARDKAVLLGADVLTPQGGLHAVGLVPAGPLTAVDPFGSIRLLLSDPIDNASAAASVALVDSRGPIDAALVLAPDGRSITFVPRRPLLPNAVHGVLVTNGLRARHDGSPSEQARLSFATGLATAAGDATALVVNRPGGAAATLVRADDRNRDGDLDDPDEVQAVASFPVAGLAQDPAAARDGSVLVPDSRAAILWRAADADGDGLAGAAEVKAFFDRNQQGLPGLALSSLASVAVLPDGALLLANNGAAGSADWVVRLVDANQDGDANDAGEATMYSSLNHGGAIMALACDPLGVAWYVVSGAGAGLYRLEDRNRDGDADDAGETVLAAAVANGMGELVLGEGFAPFAWGLASATSPRLVRVRGGVAEVVLGAPAPGAVVLGDGAALLAAPGGAFVFADGAASRLVRLADGNGDRDVADAGEQTVVHTNLASQLPDAFAAARGAAPAAPVLFARPQAGDRAVLGVAAPGARVRVQVGAGPAVIAVATASGRFEAPLAAALAAGDSVSVSASTLAGRSRVVARTVR